MNSMIGKSTGIALLMAAALIAALFAMGVFSATGVGAQTTPASPTFEDGGDVDLNRDGDTDDTVTNAFAVSETATENIHSEDSAFRFLLERGSDGAPDAVMVGVLTVTFASDAVAENTSCTINPTVDNFIAAIPTTGDNIGKCVLSYTGDDPGFASAIATGTTALVVEARDNRDGTENADDLTGTAPVLVVPYEDAANSDVPGKAIRLSLIAYLDVAGDEEITFNLKSFGLPGTIEPEKVDIRTVVGGTTSRGNPLDVSISGSNVSLTLDVLESADAEITTLGDANQTTITFRSSAGISNPTAHGIYEIGVKSEESANRDVLVNRVAVNRFVKVAKDKGARGSEVAITGGGFSGSVTVFIDGTRDADPDATPPVTEITASNGAYDPGVDKIIKSNVSVDDGKFETTVEVGDKFSAGNTINAIDSNGKVADENHDASFSVSGKISVEPEEISFSETLTVKVADWKYGSIGSITFGGTRTVNLGSDNITTTGDLDEDGKATIEVDVPSGVRTGTHQVKVNGETGSLSSTVMIKPLDLTVQPESAVPGQQITVKGSGFVGDQNVTIKVGAETIGNRAVSGSDPETNSSGNMNVTFTLPDAEKLDEGTATITVLEDSSKREGRVTLTVPEATITLDPSESGYGSSVTVSGSGFPANESLDIEYWNADDEEFEPVGIARSDSTGDFSGSFNTPEFADSGEENDVRVIDRDEEREDTAKHSLPAEGLSASPAEIQSGGTIVITATNLPLHTTVSEVMIGRTDVTPSPKPLTDGNGEVSITVVAPQLQLGNQPISITVNDNKITDSVKIVTESAVAAPTDPAEVFAELISDGSLSRVWYLDPQSQTWSFYDPDPAFAAFNELNAVKSEETYILIITAEDTFGTKTLYPGTQFVTIP